MTFTSLPSRASVRGARLIDFQTAKLTFQPVAGGLHLCVEGELTTGDLDARLAPRHYSDVPNYWAIEVVAVQVSPPADANGAAGKPDRFACSIALTDFVGLRGITVVGANRVQRIDIAPVEPCSRS